jgi:hypothetical protein
MQHNVEFRREVRMDFDAFHTLLDLIRDNLTVDNDMAARRGGPITPEMCLYSALNSGALIVPSGSTTRPFSAVFLISLG